MFCTLVVRMVGSAASAQQGDAQTVKYARGGGIGAQLLARAEAMAREDGLVGIYLDTFEFQAPRFYLREGYREIGRLPKVGDAPQRIWFAKEFNDTGSTT